MYNPRARCLFLKQILLNFQFKAKCYSAVWSLELSTHKKSVCAPYNTKQEEIYIKAIKLGLIWNKKNALLHPFNKLDLCWLFIVWELPEEYLSVGCLIYYIHLLCYITIFLSGVDVSYIICTRLGTKCDGPIDNL